MERLFPVALASVALVACASPPPITGRVETRTITSASTGADYTVLVRLPPGYDAAPERRYPVIVQLDATFLGQFERTAGHASALEAEGAIPAAIVVGVARAEGADDGALREQDFAPPPRDPASDSRGRADRFLAFLVDELLPDVDASYRTDRASRVLSGHSMGGLFALYAFFATDEGTAPTFEHVIAADPSYGHDRGVIFGYEALLAERAASRPGSLFLTVALETGAGQTIYLDEMGDRIEARGYLGLRLGRALLDTDHGGAIEPSVEQGLVFALGAGDAS